MPTQHFSRRPPHRVTSLVVALLLLSGCRDCKRRRMTEPQALEDLIVSHVKPHEPGYAVLVARDGKPVLRAAYGLARVDGEVAMTPGHAFQIGSITKQFTAAAVLLLESEGKLSLDDELARWAPTFPTGGKHVTLRQLLANTSGIPDFTNRPEWTAHLAQHDGPEQFLARFAAPPQTEPGSEWFYSNTGYYLLGTIIARASGTSYGAFLRARFFTPLGMTHSRTMAEAPLPGEQLANGYQQDGARIEPAPVVDDSQVGAAGDLVSTVDDLLLWDEALRHGRVLPEAALERARTPVTTTRKAPPFEWTLGWARFKVDGVTCFGAKGGIDSGYTTWLSDCPGAALTVVVLTNSTDPRGPPDKLGNELAAELLRRAAARAPAAP